MSDVDNWDEQDEQFEQMVEELTERATIIEALITRGLSLDETLHFLNENFPDFGSRVDDGALTDFVFHEYDYGDWVPNAIYTLDQGGEVTLVIGPMWWSDHREPKPTGRSFRFSELGLTLKHESLQ